jgi:hypothetical protein
MQYFTIHANLKIHLWSLEGQHFVFDLAAVEEFGFGLFILTREIDWKPPRQDLFNDSFQNMRFLSIE